MRLFTAIDLPAEMLLRLERLLSALRPEALIKWSPLDNLHITTKFIGEWPEQRLDELHQALVALTPRETFDIDVRDLGWFPNERSPRVLWAGVHAGPALKQLIAETEERLLALGIPKEEKQASPHLTLARIKNPAPLRNLRKKVEELQPAELGTFSVRHFYLFRSDPGSNASIYRRLRDYQFEVAIAAHSL
jgi:2'-5' RNA ligase